MREGTDFRGRIGEALAGRTMSWPDSNPSPPLYMYEKDVDLYRHYVRCIRATLVRKSVIPGKLNTMNVCIFAQSVRWIICRMFVRCMTRLNAFMRDAALDVFISDVDRVALKHSV